MNISSRKALAPLSDDDAVTLLARRLPKAELHAHHTGALRPSRLASLTKTRPGLISAAIESSYDNDGPDKFFRDLERSAAVWDTQALLRNSVVEVASDAFDHGVRHLELLVTPALSAAQAGIAVQDQLAALHAGFSEASDLLGITGGLIVELHRPDGAEAALRLVDEVLRARDAGVPVLGIGNDGNHRTVPLEVLAPAYVRSLDNELCVTGHVMTVEDFDVAIGIGLHRIDHGWFIADDPERVRRLVRSGATMTFTPMAYTIGGHEATMTWANAYRVLDSAGVPLIIGTDDPALHHTDLAHSYELVARRLDWGPADIAAAAKRSFTAAWGLPAEAVDKRSRAVDDMLESPRSPRHH